MFINVVGLKLQGIPERWTSYSSAPPQSPLVVLVMLLYMYNLEKWDEIYTFVQYTENVIKYFVK